MAKADIRLLVVADAVEFGVEGWDIGFNISVLSRPAKAAVAGDLSGRHCGTVCCVAGWAAVLFPLQRIFDGIDLAESNKLICPPRYTSNPRLYPPKRTAAVIRHLVATGKTEWERFDKQGKEISNGKEAKPERSDEGSGA